MTWWWIPTSLLILAALSIRPYDWAGVFGWAFRRRWQEQDAWFCSELVAWAFEQAGHPLLRADSAWRLTPRDLLMSPRLTRIDL